MSKSPDGMRSTSPVDIDLLVVAAAYASRLPAEAASKHANMRDYAIVSGCCREIDVGAVGSDCWAGARNRKRSAFDAHMRRPILRCRRQCLMVLP